MSSRTRWIVAVVLVLVLGLVALYLYNSMVTAGPEAAGQRSLVAAPPGVWW